MREKVYVYKAFSEALPIQDLGFREQLRLLLGKLFNDPLVESKNEEALIAEVMTRKADCMKLLHGALRRMEREGHSSVRLEVSSKFESVLTEILEERYSKFYKITIRKPVMEYDAPFKIQVDMEPL